MGECQSCRQQTKGDRTLCLRCHVRLARLLLRLASDVMPMRDSLDATLHPGGHQPNRIQPSVPPTPIRLDVLDLLDILDSTAHQLWHVLDGTEQDKEPSLRMTITLCARHPRLGRFADAGFYLSTIAALAARIDLVLDPPAERREVGTCELCSTMLTAGSRDQWLTCSTCGCEQRVSTVKLRRLKTLCYDDSKVGTAAEIARAFTDSGISVKRHTINVWASRGKLERRGKDDSGKPVYAYCDVYRHVIKPPDLTDSKL